MGWMPAGDGYQVTLDPSTLAPTVRNAAGRTLKSVPGKLRDDPAVLQLRRLAEFLERHAREALDSAERWMLGSRPVPLPLIAEVWPDPSWRTALADLVVAPPLADDPALPDLDRAGLLRGAGPEGLGLVDLDGDTVRLPAAEVAAVLIPHPVHLRDQADLEEFRDFGTELGVDQAVEQLFREVWRKPEPSALPAASAVREFAGGQYRQLSHLTGRAAALGIPVRGGEARRTVTERGGSLTAAVYLGEGWPGEEAETGPLTWQNGDGRTVPLARVGPVAWSEGMRMAAALYSGRVVPTREAQG